MGPDCAKLRCCEIEGTLSNLARANRVVCTCKDCRAFIEQLGRGPDLLDEYGGTDILQTAPCFLKISRGQEHLRALRLSPKGMVRWYCSKCHAPWGNCLASPKIPFIGIPIRALMEEGTRALLTPPRYVSAHAALKPPPNPVKPVAGALMLGRSMFVVLRDKLAGRAEPHPFLNEQGEWVSSPSISS